MKNLKGFLFAFIALAFFASCDDSDDLKDVVDTPTTSDSTATKPTPEVLKPEGDLTTLKGLVDKQAKQPVKGVKITTNTILEGRVTSNGATKNMPNGIYVQLEGSEQVFKISAYNDDIASIKVGQKIKFKALNKYIGISYDDYVIGDSISDRHAVKSFKKEELDKALEIIEGDIVPVAAKEITISDLFAHKDDYRFKKGIVIKINDVQFDASFKDQTYFSGKESYSSTYLIDKDGNRIAISTYKSATFGAEKVKGEKSGSVTALLSIFRGTPQLILRSTDDLDFTKERFNNAPAFEAVVVDSLEEKFNDITLYENVSLAGWFTEVVEGKAAFQGKAYGGNKYAQLTGDTIKTESWLVTPVLNLEKAKYKNFSFATKRGKSANEKLEVYISSNFDANKGVSEATWEKLEAKMAAAEAGFGKEFTNSGAIDLSAKSGQVVIAFKYTADGSKNAGIYQIDDVKFSFDPNEKEEVVLPSPGFENWIEGIPAGWALTKGSKEMLEKDLSDKMEGTASLHFKGKAYIDYSAVEVKAGGKYKVSFQYKMPSRNSKDLKLYSYELTASNAKEYEAVDKILRNVALEVSTEWKKVEIEYTAGDNATKFVFGLRAYEAEDLGWKIDDLKIEKITE